MAKTGKNYREIEAQETQKSEPVMQFTVTSRPEYAYQWWNTTTLVCDRLDEKAQAFVAELLRKHGIARIFAGTDCSPENELFSIKKSREKKSKDKMSYCVAFSVFVSDKLQELDKDAIHKIVAAQGGEIQDENCKKETSRSKNPGYKVRVTAEIGQIDLALEDKARRRQMDGFADMAIVIAKAVSKPLLREANAYRLADAA